MKIISFVKKYNQGDMLKNVLVGAMVLVIGFLVYSGLSSSFSLSSSTSPDKNSWQAVFLENEQVYFGKLKITKDFYILENVYYLQTEEVAVAGVTDSLASPSVDIEETTETSTKLVKLGNELHGPQDKMFIEKSKVIFWENMKDTSDIVRSIKNSNQ